MSNTPRGQRCILDDFEYDDVNDFDVLLLLLMVVVGVGVGAVSKEKVPPRGPRFVATTPRASSRWGLLFLCGIPLTPPPPPRDESGQTKFVQCSI